MFIIIAILTSNSYAMSVCGYLHNYVDEYYYGPIAVAHFCQSVHKCASRRPLISFVSEYLSQPISYRKRQIDDEDTAHFVCEYKHRCKHK